MKRQDFHFDLPAELIAQQPLAERSASRLLRVNRTSGELNDRQFSDLPEFLRTGDLLVFNNTQVIKARLRGHKTSGGAIEILIERLLDDQHALAQVRASKSPKPGSEIVVAGARLTMVERVGSFFSLRSAQEPWSDLLERAGQMPLPPYIERHQDVDCEQSALDEQRYQTVYAAQPGAVAAPTAGLHFDQGLLDRLTATGVNFGFVTLHVGAGTFQPMRVDDLSAHRMHSERIEVDQTVCDQIHATRLAGSRVYAVGTTSVRSLETAWRNGAVQPFAGESDIFIYPGVKLNSIDGLITNFHLPESTLIMLVSAFAGTQQTLAAYRHAVDQRYRFFSYGDAMLIDS